jgi:pimeloyl-ACP methyl ester carboxylesterase
VGITDVRMPPDYTDDGLRAAILNRVILPCDDFGSGPAVLLLHAGVADRRMWSEHCPVIAAAGYRAIAADLPGFGDAVASGVLAPWSDVLETLDVLGVDRFAVIGNSFGGAVALRIAACAPERVAALVLVSVPPPNLNPSPELQAAWEAEESALARGDIDAAVAAVLDAWTLPDVATGVRDRVARMQRRAFELAAAVDELPEAEDPLTADPGALERLEIPALVCAGELDMPDFRAGAHTLARALGPAPPVVIAGVGHLAPMEQPASFRQLALDFLSRNQW